MRRLFAAGAALAVLGASVEASASGLYVTDRGVRPLGRGGAYVAGADDLSAITYNPAGLVLGGTQVLFDASLMLFSSRYTRKALVRPADPNTGAPLGTSYVQTFEAVDGKAPPLPLPTLAGSYALTRDLVLGAGLWAPYASLASYPEKLGNGQPAPQRYSLISLDGSALVMTGLFVSYRPTPWLMVGAGPQLLLGTFQSSVYFGACVPDRFICAPEQPDYDARGVLKVSGIAAPSGTFGAIVAPHEQVKVGLSFSLPHWIDAGAKLTTRLPSAAVFDGARVDGDSAQVSFKLPWVLRAGVEARPFDKTRIEASLVVEGWSMHDRISAAPDGVALRDVSLFPPEYRLSNIDIERGFQNSWSLRLGGEQELEVGGLRVDARAGFSYDRSAVPVDKVSVLSLDWNKLLLTAGGSLHATDKLRLDLLIAGLVPSTIDVDTKSASLYKVSPVQANRPPGGEPAINGGRYEVGAFLLGLGVRYQLGG